MARVFLNRYTEVDRGGRKSPRFLKERGYGLSLTCFGGFLWIFSNKVKHIFLNSYWYRR